MSWFYDHFINTMFFIISMFGLAIIITAILAYAPKKKKKQN